MMTGHSNKGDIMKQMINKYEQYLDDLRESGITNIYAAAPFLMAKFDLLKSEARKILVDWITR